MRYDARRGVILSREDGEGSQEATQPRILRSFAPLRMTTIGIATLFLAPRIALLFARQPFFDELFTRWISARSFEGILQALRYDSGPPLYYFIIHAIGDPPILVIRSVSLLFSAVPLIWLLKTRRYGAAALLSVFPPAVLFAVDARSYALCAMFAALGIFALESEKPYAAAWLFLAAAYSHYYGALFFPLILCGDRLQPVLGRLKPAAILILFAPGAWLALHQPRESMAWLSVFFHYPDTLFAKPPEWLLVIGAAVVVLAMYRLERYAAMTFIPLVLAVALGIYFPLRFESMIAVPLVLWFAQIARREIVALLVAVGMAICVFGIIDHAERPVDAYRDAAMHARTLPGPVIASGYLYLETITLRPATAFPAEQALHPGWRATATSGSDLPSGTFIWVGELRAPELAIIEASRRVTPLYV
ncbi:MAG: hypothetical protein DMF58_08110, partial [Acidobacteria bacterium]